jgi:hypothetical protein
MFHVPEPGRLLHGDRRLGPASPWGSDISLGNNGCFVLPSPVPGWSLFTIASDEDGWEHVSVHAFSDQRLKQRLPTWTEMMLVKRTFWGNDDVCMQLAPRESDYVNCHPVTLHWWRPIDQEIPTPPSWMVGPKR